MLGFTALSQAPLSQSTTSSIALAFLASAIGQFTPGAILFDAKALHTTASVSASTAANILFDAQAAITTADAIASTAISDVLYAAQAGVTPSAATASFTTGTLDYEALAHITPTGAVATGEADQFGDVDAKANITTTGTISNTSVNDFADVFGKANVVPSAVSAFLTIYIGDFADEDAQARAFIPPAVSVTNITSVDFDAESNITTGSAIASVSADTLAYDAKAVLQLSSILANLYRNLDDPVTVVFPYQDFADDYNTGRTLFVSAYEGSTTVHIAEEDYTVYTQEQQRQQGSSTVHITEEDYTVYIQEQQGSNTVYIAA